MSLAPVGNFSVRAALWLAAATLVGAADASAAPQLRCHIEQGGNVHDLQISAVSDPYGVAPVDINGRFRFKAVMVGDDKAIAYIKLYTYYTTKRQPVLLHVAKYLAPVPQAGQDPAGLTGVTYLYSPLLGREIQYGCALLREAA